MGNVLSKPGWFALALLGALTCEAQPSSRAEVVSITIGVNPSCPYGLET